MFERASRLKLRFNYKGVCNVEDLWDMPLEKLNKLYTTLNKQLKENQEESLLKKRKTKEDTVFELSVKIIKHIVETRLDEEEVRKDRAEKCAKKQKILKIIEEKQDKELLEKDVDELKSMLEDEESS